MLHLKRSGALRSTNSTNEYIYSLVHFHVEIYVIKMRDTINFKSAHHVNTLSPRKQVNDGSFRHEHDHSQPDKLLTMYLANMFILIMS